jgi:hypothetical protein
MTTEQLQDACLREGVRVTVTQLGRWVQAGLIPECLHVKRGRGRGKGTEWLWASECLPRALIIARTFKQHKPSNHRAARALAEAGYAPDVERLRAVLLSVLDEIESYFTKRQRYLQDGRPLPDKRNQLIKNVRRKGPDLPDVLTEYLGVVGSILHGVISPDDADGTDMAGDIARTFSFPVLRQRLAELDGPTLLMIYELAGQALPAFVPQFVAVLNDLMLPFLAMRKQAARHSGKASPQEFDLMAIDLASIMGGIKHEDGRVIVAPDNPAGGLRLLMALVPAAVFREGTLLADELPEALEKWQAFTSHGWQLVSDYLGHDVPSLYGVGTHATNRGEGTETNSIQP